MHARWLAPIAGILTSLTLPAAQAGPIRDAAEVCAQIRSQLDDPNRSPSEVATWIQRDDRTYTPEIAACVCAEETPSVVHRAVRAHLWSDTFTTPQAAVEVYLGDPTWSVEQELALHLLRWISEVHPRKGFHVLPVHVAAPPWFDLGRFVHLMGVEQPGVAMLDPTSVLGGGLTSLPQGRLSDLLGTDALANTDLSNLEGTTPATLWLDLSTAPSGDLSLSWSLRPVVASGAAPELQRGALDATPRTGALIDACLRRDPAAARAWNARVAEASRVRPFDVRVEIGAGGFTGYPAASGTSLQAASAIGLGALATTSFPDRAVFEAASGLRIPIGVSLRWRYAYVGLELAGRVPLVSAQPTHRLVLSGDAWNAKALYSLDLGITGGAKVDVGPIGLWAGLWAGGAYSYAAVNRTRDPSDVFAVSGFGLVAGPRVGVDARFARRLGVTVSFVGHVLSSERATLAPFIGSQLTFWLEP